MVIRWKLDGVHSHNSKHGAQGVTSTAAVHHGPIHSVSFRTGDVGLTNCYECLVVDGVKGQCMIIDCQATNGNISREIDPQTIGLGGAILCADWNPNTANEIVVGCDDGRVGIVNLDQLDSTVILIPPIVQENEEDVNWSCTHIHLLKEDSDSGATVAAGFCRVFPEDDVDGEDDDDSDGDNDAMHEANFLIYDLENKLWTELGDVVPFFGVPRFGRHVFYSNLLGTNTNRILLVGCNVTGEICVIAHIDEQWEVCELQEGNGATAPVSEDDEFTFPTGLSTTVDKNGMIRMMLSATDGSLSVMQIDHCKNEEFASTERHPWMICNEPVEKRDVVLPSDTKSVPKTQQESNNSADKSSAKQASFGSQTSGGFTFGSNQAKPYAKEVSTSATPFGSGEFGFGRQSSLSSSFGSMGFGASSASKPAASSFGLSSANDGTFSLAPTANLSSPAPKLSESEKNAPIFGSGSKAPVFGFGAVSAISSSNASGFESFAANASTGTGFGALSAASKSEGFGFSATKNTEKQTMDPTMIKPLFGAKVQVTESLHLKKEKDPVIAKSLENIVSKVPPTTEESKTAARAFDTIDAGKKEIIDLNKVEDLLDEVGEGFHGDEFDKQVSLLDPNSKGTIDRATFIQWYCDLIEEGENDGSSIDTEEREEREEEKAKATKAFHSITTSGEIPKSSFVKLMEELGTTYCEEEHRRTIRKISDEKGNIGEQAFVTWYLGWLFGNGDDESDFSDEEEESGAQESKAPASAVDSNTTGKGWGSMFTVDNDSWKCESCMIRNNGNTDKCVACDTVRPGYEEKASAVEEKSTNTSSNFSFGTKDAKSSGISFGFNAASVKDATKANDKSAGFSFGFKPATAKNPDLELASGSTNGIALSGGGFSFGFAGQESKKLITPQTDTNINTAVPVIGRSFNFGFVAPKSDTLSSSGALPPSSEAKKVLKVSSTSSSSSGAFPPMAKTAP
eukprot:CAMPEP_0194101508 /NCGR_PEP_ID=MMETSP0150-20130528/2198_1 /TAXON_ID=122233 /ORGANISM="Chaetoceros debilis, Strain MM31A-1" /LENGTH=964 /DNA_ID=CAMNT_0038788139 /DNA_START=385 /DNA_END=3275 /DNA_ORIENTATION=-